MSVRKLAMLPYAPQRAQRLISVFNQRSHLYIVGQKRTSAKSSEFDDKINVDFLRVQSLHESYGGRLP